MITRSLANKEVIWCKGKYYIIDNYQNSKKGYFLTEFKFVWPDFQKITRHKYVEYNTPVFGIIFKKGYRQLL